jgi:MFS family permease
VTTQPTLRGNLKALPRPAWILFGGSFLNRFGSFVITFLVLYVTRQGYSPTQAGLVVASYGLGSLPAAAFGGFLADRFGRRETIALSMFGAAAAMVALSQAHSLTALFLLSALAGLAAELYRPASGALLADLVPSHRRVAAFGMYRLAINAGFAVGTAVAGFMAERSFTLLFLGDAVSSVLFGIVVLVGLPRTKAGENTYEPGSLRVIARDRRFALFLLVSLIGAFVYFQMEAGLPLHIRDSGLSYAIVGLLLALNGAACLVLELPVISITQRLRARPVIAVGVALTGVGFFLTQFAHSVWPLAFTVLVWTFGEVISAPVSSAYVADLAPAAMRGRYTGTHGLTFSLSFVLAPALGGWLYSLGPEVLFTTCGILGLLAAGLVLIPVRGPEHPVESHLEEAVAPEPVRSP